MTLRAALPTTMLRRSFLRTVASIPAAGLLARFPLAAQQGALQVTTLAPKPPITRLINTHWHYDHTGGNTAIGKAGAKILAHVNTRAHLSVKTTTAFLQRSFDALPAEGLPTGTLKEQGRLKHGADSLHYLHLPPAHTDGDITVHFQSAKLLHGGDLLFFGMYPFIDYSTGGSLTGMAANAERISKSVDDKTKVIPGHGPVGGKQDVKEFATMLAACLESMQRLIRSGKTLEQVQAAQPTKAFDAKWGAGFLKPEQFVALSYAGMKK